MGLLAARHTLLNRALHGNFTRAAAAFARPSLAPSALRGIASVGSGWLRAHVSRAYPPNFVFSWLPVGDSTPRRLCGPGTVRRATLGDVPRIMSMLGGPMSEGSILPVTPDEVASNITKYFIYVVDKRVVGSACLKEYGPDCAELSKIVTEPQFRGMGIGGDLVQAMSAAAMAKSMRYVFALSTEPAMCRVFERHGFCSTDRAALAPSWAKGYDMSRPSRAFKLPIQELSNDALS